MQHTFISGALALFVLFLALPFNAKAYIDPATTTYVIQIVSALVITLGITIGVFFSRIRMFFLNVQVKLAEWKVKTFSKKQAAATPSYLPYIRSLKAAPQSKWAALWQDNRPYLQRLITAFCISAGVAFTFVAFGPYELYALNIDTFAFKLSDIYGTIFLLAVVCALVLTLLISLLRGKPFDFLISALLGILLAGYIQGNFMNTSLGQLTGDFIAWNLHARDFTVNLLIWLAIIILPFILQYFNRKAWAFLSRIIPLVLVMIQLISMASLQGDVRKHQPETEKYLSTAGLYEVASKDNIIVIILDRLDNTYINSVLSSEPDFFAPLDGFTRFPDHTTLYSATFPSVCNMLTGEIYMYERSSREFLTDAYKKSTFLPGLRDDGYRVKLYTEPRFAYLNASDLEGSADNISVAELTVQHASAIKEFMRLSAYRSAPIAFKPFFWTSTDQFTKIINKDTDPAPYTTDDFMFYNTLREKRLAIGDYDKAFSFIHLNGPHAPYNMNENVEQVPPHEGTPLGQTKGSFRLVYEYLDQLKALGLYKDSTIIITGDHGARHNDHQAPYFAITAGLFVKPKGVENVPFNVNMAPVSTDNFRATIYQAAGLPAEKWGESYFDVPLDATDPRYLYHVLVESAEGPLRLLIYEINGFASDFKNWTLKEELLGRVY